MAEVNALSRHVTTLRAIALNKSVRLIALQCWGIALHRGSVRASHLAVPGSIPLSAGKNRTQSFSENLPF